jgi:ferredoxin--NADP+ reductase
MAVIEDYDSSRRFTGTVLASKRITPAGHDEEVRQILVEVDQLGVDFAAYESVGVLAHGPEELGSPLFLRLYAVAGFTPAAGAAAPVVELCVRRCFYIDEMNGDRYPGAVSNFLCDLTPGDTIDLTGPFGNAFPVPEDPDANLVMIGMGTGIAPFRTLIKRLYDQEGEWRGQVRLFHGAKTGLDLLYRNDENEDLGLYMSKETFKAYEALSRRPHFGEAPALDAALLANKDEVWGLLDGPHGHVYVAGLRQIGAQLDKAFGEMAGSEAAWQDLKDDLVAEGRWRELLY